MAKIEDISFKAAAKFTIYTTIVGSVIGAVIWFLTRSPEPQQAQAGREKQEEFKCAV